MINADQILQRIKNSVRATDPDAILILYGSYARGDYRDDSDIDILVLLDKDKITHDDRERIGYPIHHIELETETIITPMFYSKKMWDSKLRITPFYKNVMREGKLL